MSTTVTHRVHFGIAGRGRKQLRLGGSPKHAAADAGRIPRVARLMALAIKFDRLIGEGAIADQAELACLGHVTRARVTQVMNLLHLAPDIQEEILHLPAVHAGRDPIGERDLRPIVREILWADQREMWAELRARADARRNSNGTPT